MLKRNSTKRSKGNINKRSVGIFAIFLLEGVLGLIILTQYMVKDISNWKINNGLVLVYAIINLGGIIGIKYFIELLDKEIKYHQLLVELQKSDEVLVTLRAHKHDFFNHLQVIMGLAQLDKTDRIITYIKDISHNVAESYAIANIKVPEIAIVLMQKLGEASNKGIQVETIIDTTCENLRGQGIIYAQILFNLLDNAIYELQQLNVDEKILRVEIKEEKEQIEFIIFNNLPIIQEKDIPCVFNQGFTTKEGMHEGLGLWNVQKLVNANRGKIKVKSRPDYGTAFQVKFPQYKELH